MRTKIDGVIYTTCPACKGNGGKKITVMGIGVPDTKVKHKCQKCSGRGKLPEAELEKGKANGKDDNDISGS